jgi:hypothetical protein
VTASRGTPPDQATQDRSGPPAGQRSLLLSVQERFLRHRGLILTTAGGVTTPGNSQLREAAELITGAASAWRMPDTGPACPYPAG